ncbi:MAG TPA: hypothetical protein VM143_09805 [Acidimicrobiales bacterium]|nr:hypothetical protein [Acidimicrobiales bacterium]
MPVTPRHGGISDEAGFTVIELSVTMAIAMTVMASLLGILVSQTNAEKRLSSFADNQEILRQAMVSLQRDIRSAEPLERLDPVNGQAQPASAYALQIKLNVYTNISLPAVPIRWVVDTTKQELRRELLDGSGAITYRVPGVVNSYGAVLFEFYKAESDTPYNLATDDPQDIAHCSVRIRVNLLAAPNRGPQPVLLSSDAQLRNRLPGGVGCAAPTVTP